MCILSHVYYLIKTSTPTFSYCQDTFQSCNNSLRGAKSSAMPVMQFQLWNCVQWNLIFGAIKRTTNSTRCQMGGFSFTSSNRIKLRKHILALDPVIRPKLQDADSSDKSKALPEAASSGQRWVLTPEQFLELCKACCSPQEPQQPTRKLRDRTIPLPDNIPE